MAAIACQLFLNQELKLDCQAYLSYEDTRELVSVELETRPHTRVLFRVFIHVAWPLPILLPSLV